MPDGDDRDHLSGLVHSIDNDVASDDDAPQTRIDALQEPPSEMWVLGECLDPIEQILNDTQGSRRVVFGDKVQELRDSPESRIRPDDAIAHKE
jgi:hypothetical protein